MRVFDGVLRDADISSLHLCFEGTNTHCLVIKAGNPDPAKRFNLDLCWHHDTLLEEERGVDGTSCGHKAKVGCQLASLIGSWLFSRDVIKSCQSAIFVSLQTDAKPLLWWTVPLR